jgi:hypothetical protein
MRTKPAIPEPQGKTPMERMDWAFRTVLKAPKEEYKPKERTKHPPKSRTSEQDPA